MNAARIALEIISKGEATLDLNQKTWKFYGSWVNDYHNEDAAYRNGIDPKEYGKCDAAIRIKGCTWEVGLYKRGNAWIPVMDFWGSEGQKLSKMFGRNMEKFMTEYNKQATIAAATRQGHSWTIEGNKIIINTGSSGNAWGPQKKGWIK